MFTYTLALACFLLLVSCFLKKMMIYIALAAAWGGVIYVIADMSKHQDMSNSVPMQCVAAIIMLWAILQMFRVRRGDQV